ncbi:craniofacial development protein 2-like [Palaemon carinicauda]|uniref:craniofacial development protein 2-like n=1 Tax=Palaemon carinicauda TaxID=392227 RepID=UPI0035B6877E
MDKHTKGIGFLVNKNIKNSVLGCCPVSSKAISIRLTATPFNITIVQAYAPTTDHDDDAVGAFYSQLQETIDKVDKKDILIIQGDWNAKVGKDALKDWKKFCGPSCNDVSNERELRLLEFASYNNAVVANTLGEHKASRRWTWHAPNGIHHNQIDYILVQNQFRSGIKRATTRTFPGADVGSDHDLVFVNFNIAESFKATVGGKFAPLLTLEEDHSAETLTAQFNKIMIESANETLGNVRRKTQRWVTDEIMDMCDKRRELKKNKTTPTGATEYREINRKIGKSMNQAKEDWIGKQCTEIEEKLEKNNSRRAFPNRERSNKNKASKSQYHPRQSRELPHGKRRHTLEVDRVLF